MEYAQLSTADAKPFRAAWQTAYRARSCDRLGHAFNCTRRR